MVFKVAPLPWVMPAFMALAPPATEVETPEEPNAVVEPVQTPTEPDPIVPPQTPKGMRKSEKDWQELRESATKSEEGLKTLREELALAKWEGEHGVVKEERYAEAWKKVNKEPRYAALDYDERFSLISSDRGERMKNELLQQVTKMQGSVPRSSTGTESKPRVSADLLESGKAWGFKAEDYEKAGVY